MISALVTGLSGLLFVALAVFAGTRRPHTRANFAFAIYGVGYGIDFLIAGIFMAFGPFLSPRVVTLLLLILIPGRFAIGPALLGLAANAPRPLVRRQRLLLVPAIVFGAGIAAAMFPYYISGQEGLLNVASSAAIVLALMGTYGAAVLLSLRFHAAKGPHEGRGRFTIALLVAAIMLQEGMRLGGFATDGMHSGDMIALVAILIIGFAWLLLTEHGGGLVARRVAWTVVAAPLVGMLIPAILHAPSSLSFSVARIVAVILIAYAILRHQLFDIDVKVRWGISRGTIAGAFVAVFFIASEGAQILFGRGNEWVGLFAAGALVFAIAPLQRAAERLAERAVPAAPASSATTQGADVFRRAVRLAIKDRRLTHDEELELATVAHDLGLTAPDATRIRLEIERESEYTGREDPSPT